MGEPILNLSAWIDRRRKEVGPYADHIVHSVKAYEARITALEEENKRLQETLKLIRRTSQKGGISVGLRMTKMDDLARTALKDV
jgi:hypothetical protein